MENRGKTGDPPARAIGRLAPPTGRAYSESFPHRAAKLFAGPCCRPPLALGLLILLVLAATWHPASAGADTGARRVALLIADANYPDADTHLQTAYRDADLLAGELARDGFESDIEKDGDRQTLQAAIATFLGKVMPHSTALLYFNGIGLQVDHETYLVPVNAGIWSEADVKHEGIGLDTLVADISRRGADATIVIVDAARRNPFERRFRATAAGLASLNAPDGTLVIYATTPNKVGRDALGDVSLFMSELVKQLRAPDVTAEEAMMHARVAVSQASDGEQIPWVASSLVQPFSFTVQADAPQAVPVPREAHAPTGTPGTRAAPVPPSLATNNVSAAPAPAAGAETPAPEQVSPEATRPALDPGVVFRDCADCPELVVLPRGALQMGTGTTTVDRPVHSVLIPKPFAIATAEVTFADWERCIADGGCTYRPDSQGLGEGEHPVINISWLDTRPYLAWLSVKTGQTYRLPSEAEWEYAARGGTTSAFSWGDRVGTGMANCRDCGGPAGRRTTDVRSFPANGYGLFDMAGNAAEWVEDCWNTSYAGAPRDGSAWTSGDCAKRVLRGGSFDGTSAYVRPTARFRYDADVRYWANGFRVLREIR